MGGLRHPLAIILLALLAVAPSAHAARPHRPADEAPAARAWLTSLEARLDRVESQMPAISAAADAAAARLVAGDRFAVAGSDALAAELSMRAGAMFGYTGRRPQAGDVVLFLLHDPARQLADLQRLRRQGCHIVTIASVSDLDDAHLTEAVRASSHAVLDHAAQPSADTTPQWTTLTAAVAWTFECELFAACTRRGETPVVRKSIELDRKKRRLLRYGAQAFHHDRWLDPIAPGKLGRQYLRELRRVLLDVGTASWDELVAASEQATDSIRRGGTVWVTAGGRYVPHHVGALVPGTPKRFTPITGDYDAGTAPRPGYRDYVIAIGTHEPPDSDWWGRPEVLREAGLGVAWVINRYDTRMEKLGENETLIDLWGPVGDCMVKVDGYDARLGPVSSIAADAVHWMLLAQVDANLTQMASQSATLRR